MAQIKSQTFVELNLTMHRVKGLLNGDEMRRAAAEFYNQTVTLNVLWEFIDLDTTQIPSEEIHQIIDEVRALTHSRVGGRTAFVVTNDLDFGLGRMIEMVSEARDMPFEFRSFKSLEQAARWLGIDLEAILERFPDD